MAIKVFQLRVSGKGKSRGICETDRTGDSLTLRMLAPVRKLRVAGRLSHFIMYFGLSATRRPSDHVSSLATDTGNKGHTGNDVGVECETRVLRRPDRELGVQDRLILVLVGRRGLRDPR